MSALVAAAVAFLATVQVPLERDALERDTSAPDGVDLRVELPEGVVEVGEPFEVTLVCTHDAALEVRAAARVLEETFALDAGWHAFEVRALPGLLANGGAPPPHGFDGVDRLVTRVTYRVAALSPEPFEDETGGLGWDPARPLRGLGVEVRSEADLRAASSAPDDAAQRDADSAADRGAAADGTSATDRTSATNGNPEPAFRFVALAADPPPSVRVASLLTEGQERPRPLAGDLAPPPASDDGAWTRAAWIGGSAGLVFLVALAVAWRGARTSTDPEPAPSRLERLEAWRERIHAGEGDLRAAAFALVQEVRASYADRGAPNDRAATEQQWRAGLDPALLARGEREDLDRFLARAEAVRYAPERPTRWALEDLVRAAIEVEERTRAALGAASGEDAA